jgi:alcohol dehydrogenase (cytochrome c)/quinohemoprotein ethanol dehydrogenase
MALLAAACSGEKKAAPAAKGPAAVDAARLTNADADPGNWMSYGRTYGEQHYSPLTKVSADTVKNLGLAWYFDLDTTRGQEATPIVVDGTMYVSTAWSKVKALDAKTGALKWEFDPKVPGEWGVKACCDVVNRGVAVWKGKVYVGTIDGRLIALDAANGKQVWSTVTTDQNQPYTITGAPRVVKDKVIIGNGGAEYGVRGYVSAYDAATGAMSWRFYTVPGDPSKPFENKAMEEAAKTWKGEWWKLGGGGTVWDAIVYDPETDLVYIGVGNGSPWNQSKRSPGGGDNLYLSSIVALKADSGEYAWHYQTTPGETWDYTAVQPIVLADITIEGKPRKVLMQSPKNGFFYVLDRTNGQLISAKPIQKINWATGVDMKTGRPVENPDSRYYTTGKAWGAAPGPLGAHSWQPMAFSPKTGLVYIPTNETGFSYIPDPNYKPEPMGFNVGLDFGAGSMPQDPKIKAAALSGIAGPLVAWDPVAQKAVWKAPHSTPNNGGVLATAGGLVFQGDVDGTFAAYRDTDGQKLWSAPTQAPAMSGSMTYEVDGEQYVAVLTGWGGAWALSPGEPALVGGGKRRNIGRVLVYKLGGKATLPPLAPEVQLPLTPPAETATEAQVAEGKGLYAKYCSVCHGDAGVSGGPLPDLRYSAVVPTDAFKAIVLDGALKTTGMVSFAPVLDQTKLESVRAYLIRRAHETKRDLANGASGKVSPPSAVR